MAGYSATPLPKKLGIKLGHKVHAIAAPPSYRVLLDPLPDDVTFTPRLSKRKTDVTEHVVRAIALPIGLVDVKVCAVDDVWSGLKLVIRKALR